MSISIDIEGTTTIVCSSWLKDSMERQSGTSFSAANQIVPRHPRRNARRQTNKCGIFIHHPEELTAFGNPVGPRLTIDRPDEIKLSIKIRLRKGRDRTIERIGDGAEQFRFAFLDDAISRDRLGAGVEDVLFDLRHGQAETLEGAVETGVVAVVRG